MKLDVNQVFREMKKPGRCDDANLISYHESDVSGTAQQTECFKISIVAPYHDVGRDELKRKEEELRRYEARLLQECGSKDVSATLQQYQQSINNLQSEKGALTGSSHLFERYIRSLQRAESQCPLCHRGFDGQNEVDELVQEVMKTMGLWIL